jgi:hypothetical protein
MNANRMNEILICVEENFERSIMTNLKISDIVRVFCNFLEMIFASVTFFCFLLYVILQDKSPSMFFAIVATYVALVALAVTTTDTRQKLWDEVVLVHNINKIRQVYENNELFCREYPILKSLLVMKQKHPEISLYHLYKFDRDIFTTQNLLRYLYGIPSGNTMPQIKDAESGNATERH